MMFNDVAVKSGTVKEDMERLKGWLVTQQHLPYISDKKLILFLHSCNYQLEFTKRTIEAHYTIKASIPEFFSNRDPLGNDIRDIQCVVELALLPKYTPEGYKIIFGRLKNTDLTHFSWNSAIKLLYMICDICQTVEDLISGFVFVFDAKSLSFSHFTRLSMVTVKKYLAYTQEAMPICRKAVHIINVNPICVQLIALGRPFISQEHNQSIYLYDGVPEKFYTAVPEECLPSDYNGTQNTVSKLADETTELMKKHINWYKEDEALKLDPSKCDKQNKYAHDNVFGCEGSFRKLNID